MNTETKEETHFMGEPVLSPTDPALATVMWNNVPIRQHMLNSFGQHNSLVQHQLEPMKMFWQNYFTRIIQEARPIMTRQKKLGLTFWIHITGVDVVPPMKDPSQCQQDCEACAVDVYLNGIYTIQNSATGKNIKQMPMRALFVSIPNMIWDDMCALRTGSPEMLEQRMPADRGGYIITSTDRGIISQDSMINNFPFVTFEPLKMTSASKIRHPFGKTKKKKGVKNSKTPESSGLQVGRFSSSEPVVRIETRCQPNDRRHKATYNVFLFMRYNELCVRSDDRSWCYIHMQSGGRLSELRRHQGPSKPADVWMNMEEDREQYLSCPFTVLWVAMGGTLVELTQLGYFLYPKSWSTEENGKRIARVLMDLCISHPAHVRTQKDALQEILKEAELDKTGDMAYALQSLQEILQRDLFAHIGSSETDMPVKQVFLARILMKGILRVLKLIPDDNRDDSTLRKVETPCTLYAMLWNQFIVKYMPIISNNLRMYTNDMDKAMKPEWSRVFTSTNSTTPQFQRCLNTGDWTARKDSDRSRRAITMCIKFINKILGLSDLRRLSVPGNPTKQSMARQVDPMQWYDIDTVETPDTDQCGLVRYLSLSTKVSLDIHLPALMAWIQNNSGLSNYLQPARQWREWSREYWKTRPAYWNTVYATSALDDKKSNVSSSSGSVPTVPCYVELDGIPLGWTPNYEKWLSIVRNARRNQILDPYLSIAYHRNHEISIQICPGRLVHPLIVLNRYTDYLTKALNGWKSQDRSWIRMVRTKVTSAGESHWKRDWNPHMWTIQHLVEQGVIEYVDARERSQLSVAFDCNDVNNGMKAGGRFSHMEIHPYLQFGVSSSLIPFIENNQSPRNQFQSSMGKQGIQCFYDPRKMVPLSQQLYYAQRPMVTTRSCSDFNFDETPECFVQHAIVAKYMDGFNMEDANVINKAVLERGFGRTYKRRTYTSKRQQPKSTGHIDEFAAPDPNRTILMSKTSYAHIQPNGMPLVGTMVNAAEPVICRLSSVEKIPTGMKIQCDPSLLKERANGTNKRCDSTFVKPGEGGLVIRTHQTNRTARATIHVQHKPETGDKFSSRHGQKGVTGRMAPPEDMPWSPKFGPVSMTMNPICIPSRMTDGHMIEMLIGKHAAIKGQPVDATMLENRDLTFPCVLQHCTSHNTKRPQTGPTRCLLHAYGLKCSGSERLMSGETGKMLDMEIYHGILGIQTLVHHVSNKHQARGSNGPCHMVSRQPVESRAKGGGGRFGEMEKEAMIGHGAAYTLRERLSDCSDGYIVFICIHCKTFVPCNPLYRQFTCHCCENDDVYPVSIPYGTKLLFQECMAAGMDFGMNIAPDPDLFMVPIRKAPEMMSTKTRILSIDPSKINNMLQEHLQKRKQRS